MKFAIWLTLFATNLIFAIYGKGGLVSHFNAFVAGAMLVIIIQEIIDWRNERA